MLGIYVHKTQFWLYYYGGAWRLLTSQNCFLCRATWQNINEQKTILRNILDSVNHHFSDSR